MMKDVITTFMKDILVNTHENFCKAEILHSAAFDHKARLTKAFFHLINSDFNQNKDLR